MLKQRWYVALDSVNRVLYWGKIPNGNGSVTRDMVLEKLKGRVNNLDSNPLIYVRDKFSEANRVKNECLRGKNMGEPRLVLKELNLT